MFQRGKLRNEHYKTLGISKLAEEANTRLELDLKYHQLKYQYAQDAKSKLSHIISNLDQNMSPKNSKKVLKDLSKMLYDLGQSSGKYSLSKGISGYFGGRPAYAHAIIIALALITLGAIAGIVKNPTGFAVVNKSLLISSSFYGGFLLLLAVIFTGIIIENIIKN